MGVFGQMSKLNSNIRCIDMYVTSALSNATGELNSNIRCIEITKGINISNKHIVE